MVRAILLARATIAAFGSRRFLICSSHAAGFFALYSTLRAPCMNNMRR